MPAAECVKLGGQPGVKGSRCPRIQQRPRPDVTTHDMFVPREWQPKTVNWIRDANGNFVDDALETMPPTRRTGVFVCLNHATTQADLTKLAQFGTITFVAQYLPVIVMHDVAPASAFTIAAEPGVAHVEWNRPVFPDTDRSGAAIKVHPSTTYSPNTWSESCAVDGTGVNIAIIDTGIDDGVHASLPVAKYFYDFTLPTPAQVNPDDQDGHGTHVAAIALGRPTVFQNAVYRGVAPGAGLIDLRVFAPSFDKTGDAIVNALNLAMQKRVAWGINIVHMALGLCDQSDGKDTFAQFINSMTIQGITVIATMANAATEKCPIPAGTVRVQLPCAADRTICVQNANYQGSVSRGDDVIASNTHRGPRVDDGDADVLDEQKPDVSAPGRRGAGGILSAQHDATGSYVESSGTSIAAPHVAGLAALLMQKDPALKNDAAKLKGLIRNTAEDRGPAGWDAEWGAGLIDGNAACDALTKTAAADLQFTANCNSPDPISWTSANLYPGKNPIVEGQLNSINAIVRNNGPGNAGPFAVELGYYDLSNSSSPYYLVKTVQVPGLASGATTVVSTTWNPFVNAGPGADAHACLTGRIVYATDSNASNDCARRNVSIKGTASPAFFDFFVVNPTDEELTIAFENDLSTCDTSWAVRTPAEAIRLKPGDPPRKVTVSLDPGTLKEGAKAVAIAVVGIRPNGQQVSLSGVTLVAQTPKIRDCNGNGVDDAIDIQLGPSRDANVDGIPDECVGCVNNICF